MTKPIHPYECSKLWHRLCRRLSTTSGHGLPQTTTIDLLQPCIRWEGRLIGNSPVIRFRGSDYVVARVILARLLGEPLSPTARLKRVCNTLRCVNPAHNHYQQPPPQVQGPVLEPLANPLVALVAEHLPQSNWPQSLEYDRQAPCLVWPGRMHKGSGPTLNHAGTSTAIVRIVAAGIVGYEIPQEVRFRRNCANPRCASPAHHIPFAYGADEAVVDQLFASAPPSVRPALPAPSDPELMAAQVVNLDGPIPEDLEEDFKYRIADGEVTTPEQIVDMGWGQISPSQAEELIKKYTVKESANAL